MATATYFVVLPFFRTVDGDLVADEAIEAPDANTARVQAEQVAHARGGAVAFSRTGDPATGLYADALVLGRYGAVPDDLSEFSGA